MAYEDIQADTVEILTEWDEVLTVHRRSVSYNAAAIASISWSVSSSFLGDWQPATGTTMRNEAGLDVKSNAVVFTPVSADVQEHDRLYRDDGSYMYVRYIWEYEDHKTIHLMRNEGSD